MTRAYSAGALPAARPPLRRGGLPRSGPGCTLPAMLVVLSPAKKLDFTPSDRKLRPTSPELRKDTIELLQVAKKLKTADLKKLMSLSPQLAALNYKRFQRFAEAAQDAVETKAAALAFAGDTYVGFDAPGLDDEDLAFAQDHLRILSGLYGVLRPLDRIQPYRLEMGTKLSTERGKDLYAFWGDRIARTLEKQAARIGTNVLVNCASNEYFAAVKPDTLKLRVLTPVFKEIRGGVPKIISFSAKRARGMMARFIVQQRLVEPEGMKAFDLGGYAFNPQMSSEDEWVFVRPAAK